MVRDDGAALEVMLDGAVTDDVRLVSARRLGWEKASRVRVVAVVPDNPADFPIRIGGVGAVVEPADAECADWPGGRVGIGEVVPVLEAWRSWEQALIALRFAGTETPNLPGPHVIGYSDLGMSPSSPAPSTHTPQCTPTSNGSRMRPLRRPGCIRPSTTFSTTTACALHPPRHTCAG